MTASLLVLPHLPVLPHAVKRAVRPGALSAGQAWKIVISSNHVSFENASIILIKLKTT